MNHKKFAKWILYFNFGFSVLWIVFSIFLVAMVLYGNTSAKEFFHTMLDVSQYHTEFWRKVNCYLIIILNYVEPIIWIIFFWDYKKKQLDKKNVPETPVFLIVIAYIGDIINGLQSYDILSVTYDILTFSMFIYVVYAIGLGYLNLSDEG